MMSRKVMARKKPAAGFSGRISKFLSVERVVIGGTLLFTLAVVGVITLNSLLNRIPPIDYTLPDVSEQFPIQGAQHIELGDVHPSYNSNPPTSGWHFARPADWGIYRETLPDEALIHNLEHGGIWLSYREADDEEIIRQLEDIARRYPSHIILTYRPANDRPIAVAAWGRSLTLDTVDNTQIYTFIERYRLHGPENVA
jgi:hypothetical protein